MTKILVVLLLFLVSACALYISPCKQWSIYSESITSDNFRFSVCSNVLTEDGTIKSNESPKLVKKANQILEQINWQGTGICRVTEHLSYSRSPGYYFRIECSEKVSIEDNYVLGNSGNIYFVGPNAENKIPEYRE
jgi:hypothetical protein